MRVKLKTEDWQKQWEREMSMCLNHCIPLTNVDNNNSLGNSTNWGWGPSNVPKPGNSMRPFLLSMIFLLLTSHDYNYNAAIRL